LSYPDRLSRDVSKGVSRDVSNPLAKKRGKFFIQNRTTPVGGMNKEQEETAPAGSHAGSVQPGAVQGPESMHKAWA
jgi:hypothetical protein